MTDDGKSNVNAEFTAFYLIDRLSKSGFRKTRSNLPYMYLEVRRQIDRLYSVIYFSNLIS